MYLIKNYNRESKAASSGNHNSINRIFRSLIIYYLSLLFITILRPC